MAKNAARVGPKQPQVVVLIGATGDLSRRKLLPGLFHLCSAGFIPAWRIIGVSLDDIDADGFRKIAREAIADSRPAKSMRIAGAPSPRRSTTCRSRPAPAR